MPDTATAAEVAREKSMDDQMIYRTPGWATALHVVVLVLSLAILLFPTIRVSPLKHVLSLAFVVLAVRMFLLLRKERAFGKTLRQVAIDAPTKPTGASVLEFVALTLGAIALPVATLLV